MSGTGNDRYSLHLAAVRHLRALLRQTEILMITVSVIFAAVLMQDAHSVTEAGLGSEEFPGFKALLARNEDIAGWIRMDGTHINHPVLHGRDNFEYLSKDPDGEYYQGGSIFLDEGNARDFSDQYIIIHGHHMARGAMFSDVAEYLDKDFFENHASGQLITPRGVYELTPAGSRLVNAYAGDLYYTGPDAGRPLHLLTDLVQSREVEFDEDDKLVVLSTCAGDMTDMRAVLLCRARYTGEYGVPDEDDQEN